MRITSYRSSRVAALLAVTLAIPPGSLVRAQEQAGSACQPGRRGRRSRDATAGHQRRYRLAADRRAQSRQRRLVPAADRELGQPEADRSRGRLSPTRRPAPRSRRSARSRSKAPRTVSVDERVVKFDMRITRIQLQDAVTRAGEDAGRRRAGPAATGTRPRSRPAAGRSRRKPPRGEERRGHQGRSAEGVLGARAGGPHQPRWRADLEPGEGRRPALRGQHELGPLRAHADQDLLRALQRVVAAGDRGHRAVDAP